MPITVARSRPDSAGRGLRCPRRSPSPPPAACRRAPSPALPRLASSPSPCRACPQAGLPRCCSLPALRSSELYQLFKVQQKYFLWSLFLSDHHYEVLSSFSAQTLPASRVPFRSFAHCLGQASPPPAVLPCTLLHLLPCRCPESERGRSFNPVFATQHFLTTTCASRLVLGAEVRCINAITSGRLGRPRSCKW